MSGLLDQIEAEIGALSDQEIADAAQQIQARKERAAAAMTPERKQKMKDREKQRRLKNAAILKLAKEKGLLHTAPVAGEAVDANPTS